MTTESLENISGFESSSFSIDLGEIYTFVCGSREFWCYIGEGRKYLFEKNVQNTKIPLYNL